MSDLLIPQIEADWLLSMKKQRINELRYSYPGTGSLIIDLESEDKREKFILDIHRARIDLKRGNYQTRARTSIVLARLDFFSSPHRNPDGNEIDCPHMHIYKEGYGHKWAYPITKDHFKNIDDLWLTLKDFMKFCNIVKPPHIDRGLF